MYDDPLTAIVEAGTMGSRAGDFAPPIKLG
jgi:hypothetical protein